MALDCDTTRGDRADLGPELTALRDSFVASAHLPAAAPYRDYRVVCDDIAATSAEVPRSWGDTVHGTTSFTRGPDLEAPVEQEPVVAVETSRYVGSPIATHLLIEGVADGSLENGQRQPPRRGVAVIDGCTAGPSQPYAFGGFTGETQAYVDCDGEDRGWLIMAAFPDNGDKYQVHLIGQALTSADADALVRALGTFRVDEHRIPGLQLPPLPLPTAATDDADEAGR